MMFKGKSYDYTLVNNHCLNTEAYVNWWDLAVFNL